MDTVKVEVETAQGVDHTNTAISKNLVHKIKDNIGLSMAVEIMPPNSIPRSQGGKLSRILDKRWVKLLIVNCLIKTKLLPAACFKLAAGNESIQNHQLLRQSPSRSAKPNI